MNKEALAKIAKRAKEIAIAICGWSESNFDCVKIDIDGNISVHFSECIRGGMNYEEVYLNEEDIEMPIEETVAKYNKIKQDEVDRRAKEKEEQEKKDKIAKEKAERTIYENLKKKFEGGDGN